MVRFSIPRAFGAITACLAATAVATAAVPTIFAKSKPGLWELSGLDGKKVPVKMCVANLSELAQVQHAGRACKQSVVREKDSSITYSYQCSGSEFGQSKIDFVTPQNLRIETQGIAGGLPFSYVAQARRVSDCQAKSLPSGH